MVFHTLFISEDTGFKNLEKEERIEKNATVTHNQFTNDTELQLILRPLRATDINHVTCYGRSLLFSCCY